ncbi:MAG: DUF177 domain-containing protein [Peptoniphilus sp.]|nr:DUF177 domain-containing protein [Peptoniphilus sp.]MDD7362961.1 DUF177 domain-containing protein [Bacillota bacterium]MDY6044201.1 DUF177 domain-containing protein [Peptoniphilus sp.]
MSGELSIADSPLDVTGLGLVDPIRYHLDIYKVDGDLDVDVEVSYSFNTHCDRCFKELQEDVESDSHIVVTTKDDEEIEANVLVVPSLEEFPLEELVFSQVITSVPTKVLCDESCRGLCPVCGTDLNEHPDHECEMEGISPFESLKNLFDNESEDREV